MGTVDIDKARRFLMDKEERKKKILTERLARARQDFEGIVAMIVENYHPLRICQWGSLVGERHFSTLSDIDIAVEGIATAEEFFRMYGDAMRMTDFSLDMVRLERIEPEFRQMIESGGRIVYERA
ncbi:MAG: nucleotidyltransferase domain-containing protein [Spirochaetia bacterium]|jgi:predicted nucleotidyltransferase